jgi:hypothetical protein
MVIFMKKMLSDFNMFFSFGIQKKSLTFPWCFVSHKVDKKQKNIQNCSVNSQWLVMGDFTLTYFIY